MMYLNSSRCVLLVILASVINPSSANTSECVIISFINKSVTRLLIHLMNGHSTSFPDIIQRVFGYPSECSYRNHRLPCKLALSCWLQGGKQAQGCGNHWLFSCCVAELKVTSATTGLSSPISSAPTTLTVPIPLTILKQQQPPQPPRPKIKLKPSLPAGVGINKNQILKRRLDDHQNINSGATGGSGYKSLTCGVQPTMHNTLRKRIIGGREAQFAEYPWQAHIRIAEFQCGGVLVSRRYVATAAHCIQQANIKDITIYLGELDTQNSGSVSEPLPAEKHRVTQKIIHPLFQFRMTQPDRFDIALLRLSRPAGYR